MDRGLPERDVGSRSGRGEQEPRGSVRVRLCHPGDRGALLRLGHPPGALELFLPPLARRLGWRLSGAAARGLVAEEVVTGEVVGSVHFVRCRRVTGTWLFQHWRVAASRRGMGIGGLLLREGVRLVRGIRRLYSYVDWGNEASLRAHQRLGFAASPAIQGRAAVGALSTIGPPAPSVRLELVRGEDRAALFPLYARAMGSLWLQLLPCRDRRRFLVECDGAPLFAAARPHLPGIRGERAWSVHLEGPPVAMVLRRGPSVTLFTDPASCDAALLARVAMRIAALGVRRDHEIELRGLSRELAARRGPIAARILMGRTDVDALAPCGAS